MAASKLIFLIIGVVACLTTPTTANLSESQKNELIEAHNFYRAKPRSSNMVALEWDDELASLAQFWAVGCELEPNENRHEQSSTYDYVGEILHGSGNYSINLTSMVFEWFFEGRNYDYSQLACVDEDGEVQDDGEECEKYLQLMWAQTFKIGCGAYSCEEIAGLEDEVDEGQLPLMVVCNYGPGGGFINAQPFAKGDSCTSCPSGYDLCENKLCTESSAPELVSHISMATSLVLFAVLSVM